MKAKASGPGGEEAAAMGEQYQKPRKNEFRATRKLSRAGLAS